MMRLEYIVVEVIRKTTKDPKKSQSALKEKLQVELEWQNLNKSSQSTLIPPFSYTTMTS